MQWAASSYKYWAVLSFKEQQANKTHQEWKEKPKKQATPSLHLSSDWTIAKNKYDTCISIQDLSWDLSLITIKFHFGHLCIPNSLIDKTPPICQVWQLPCSAVCTEYSYRTSIRVILSPPPGSTFDNSHLLQMPKHPDTQTADIYMFVMLHVNTQLTLLYMLINKVMC